MEQITEKYGHLGVSSKRVARRLMTIGESRLELLLIEVTEERERFIHSLVLALGIFALGLLAMMALTTAIVVGLWAHSPVVVLLVIAVFYIIVVVALARLLRRTLQNGEPFPATFDQLRKDRVSLEQALS